MILFQSLDIHTDIHYLRLEGTGAIYMSVGAPLSAAYCSLAFERQMPVSVR